MYVRGNSWFQAANTPWTAMLPLASDVASMDAGGPLEPRRGERDIGIVT